MTECRLLVVEDNPADAFIVREALAAAGHGRFRPTFAGRLREAEPRLAAADLVLLDLSLPDSSGPETVARVKAKAPSTPVVVLSGERDDDTAFRCMQHGAQDVLLKGRIDGDSLVRSLTCALERQALAKERDEALRLSRGGQAELRGVLDVVGEGLVVTDPGRRPLFVNAAARMLLGWSPGSALGPVVDLPAEDGGMMDAGRVGLDGRPTVLVVRSAHVTWEGSPARLTAIREVPRVPAREPRWRDPDAVRTEAERFEGTRRFASGIARGLSEHLAAILEASFEHENGASRVVRESAGRAYALVRELMACAGEADAPLESLDLSEVVDARWDRFLRGAAPGVAIRKDLSIGLPKVRAARGPLEEAIRLLVEHACRSVPGGGTVTVETLVAAPEPPGGPRVVLAVTDTGPGLDRRDAERLFEPFYATEIVGTGTGLGLAPVRGIAYQFGGTAEVEGTPGRGTTVRILLPVLEEERGRRAIPGTEEAPGPDPLAGPWFPPRVEGAA